MFASIDRCLFQECERRRADRDRVARSVTCDKKNPGCFKREDVESRAPMQKPIGLQSLIATSSSDFKLQAFPHPSTYPPPVKGCIQVGRGWWIVREYVDEDYLDCLVPLIISKGKIRCSGTWYFFHGIPCILGARARKAGNSRPSGLSTNSMH